MSRKCNGANMYPFIFILLICVIDGIKGFFRCRGYCSILLPICCVYIYRLTPVNGCRKPKLPGFFAVIRPYMVLFSEIGNPTVRIGAVLKKRISYGEVRFGFQIL